MLFDLTAEPGDPPEAEEAWTPAPEPSQAELVAEGIKGLIRTPGKIAGRGGEGGERPGRHRRPGARGDRGRGRGRVGGAQPRARRSAERADRAAPAGVLGAVRAGRLQGGQERPRRHGERRLPGGGGRRARAAGCAARGVRTEGLELRGLVPVSIRTEDEQHNLGNRIAALRGPLPVYAQDPVERLQIVREAMQGIKESKQALGAEVISGLEGFAPPTLLAQASRLNFSTRLFNLIVTNVPGPAVPALPDGARDARDRAGGVPARGPRPGDRGDELQRQARLRAAGRLRRDARPGAVRRLPRGVAGGAGGSRRGAASSAVA